jgi:lipopolysaccharide transport system ATP-binding protein
MSNIAIQVENLSKRYRIGLKEERSDTLVGAATTWLKAPLANFKQLWKLSHFSENGHDSDDIIWALKHVSFEIKQGEVVGIIGRNGAGKSTLLKLLSRITEPTTGRAIINGRVSSLLEVGTGFHPDLTGRENVYLNGAVLGMTKQEIDRKFAEIIDFSGIEKFIDTPVKRYSTGMTVRLAFSVAAHLEPEILLVDEVLAVGDLEFQKKCLGKMGHVAKEGRTVLFVSHNMSAVTRLCHYAIWLAEGQLHQLGPTEEVIAAYLATGSELEGERRWEAPEEAPGNDKLRLRAVRVLNSQGQVSSMIDIRFPFYVAIEYDVLCPLPGARVGFFLLNSEGTVVFAPNDSEGSGCERGLRQAGSYVSICQIPGTLLNSGSYTLTPSADIPSVEALFFEENALRFHVERTGGVYSARPDRLPGVICPLLQWQISPISVIS